VKRDKKCVTNEVEMLEKVIRETLAKKVKFEHRLNIGKWMSHAFFGKNRFHAQLIANFKCADIRIT
jgi:hypothetical protein